MTNEERWQETYRREVGEVADEVPWTLKAFFWKVFVPIMIISVGIGMFGYAFGWFGEAAAVAQEEFGPRAALAKYEWFVSQANAIDKMDQDIKLFEVRVSK